MLVQEQLLRARFENRIGIGAEIDKGYCNIIKKRIADLNKGNMDYREDKEVPEPKGKVSKHLKNGNK